MPIAAAHKEYAQEVMQKLWDAGIYAEADLSDVTLNKKIVGLQIIYMKLKLISDYTFVHTAQC